MANQTVYPYGVGGSLPSSIGLVNDLRTGGVDKALTAEAGKHLGIEQDRLLSKIGKVDLGRWEIGSISPSGGTIADYSSVTRIRAAQKTITIGGDYTIQCNSEYLFLLYVVGKRTTAEWVSSLTFNFKVGDIYRLALKQVPDTDYAGYTQAQVDSVVLSSGITMYGPNTLPYTGEQNGADLDIVDEDGLVLARFSGGEIKTKNFDSSLPRPTLDDVEKDTDLDITDGDGLILARFANGHFKTKKFDSKNVHSGSSGAPRVDFGLPVDVPKIKITSSLLTVDLSTNSISPLTTNPKNTVGDVDEGDVTCSFESSLLNFTDNIAISYQGQTSLGHPKKNFSIDFKNKHKFGSWLPFDSFHLKGYFVDWLHSRDWVANRILEQVYRTKPSNKVRPYMLFNDFDNDIRQRADMSALCHVDAFPVELYINDEYWGLYTIRLKKSRDNYLLSKNNQEHVQIDPEIFNVRSWDWTKVEIRNPKNITNMDGTAYDGDNPQEIAACDAKTNILAFQSALAAITASSEKSDYEAILNVDTFVDAICFYELICAWDVFYRNTLYTCWDGEHFAAAPYDLDSSFGYGATNTTDWSSSLLPPDTDVFGVIANTYCRWLPLFRNVYTEEIKQRYAELRNSGVFTVANVMELFSQFSRTVGYDAYKRDTQRWNYPTNGYGENGFYDSIQRINTFMVDRINYLDNKYNY